MTPSASLSGNTKVRRIPFLAGGVVAMMAILCLLIGLTYVNFRTLDQANRLNIHTYQVLEKIVMVRSGLNEEESRLRGFALTGGTEFLNAVRNAENDTQNVLLTLKNLSQDAHQRERIKVFAGNYDLWRTRYAGIESPNLAASQRVAKDTKARRADLDDLQSSLDIIESTERGFLAQRARQQAISQHQTATVLLCASVCAISFTSFFIVMLGMQLRAIQSANRSLTVSQQRLRTVLNNVPVVLFALDNDERYTLMTGKGAESIGMSEANVIGKRMGEVVGEDYPGLAYVRKALAGEATFSKAEYAGTVFETHRMPMRDEQGQITGMIGVAMDVTERAAAEIALRDSEARFRSVIESVQEIVFLVDEEGRWTFLNPAWRLALGHEVQSSLGHQIFEYVHPGDHSEISSYLEGFRSGTVQLRRGLVRFLTRSQQWRWVDIHAQAQRDPSGRFLGMAGTISDITDRKLAQEELLATTTLQKAILNSANYTIIAVNADGVVESFNRAAQKLLGYRGVEVQGIESVLLFHDEKELEERARELSEKLGRHVEPDFEVFTLKAQDGAINESEWTYVCRDRTRVPVRLSISELRGVEGQISGFLFIGYDLTDTRRAESVKNEFVSVVSHELRTPLTSIRGALGLLVGGVAGPLPEGARQMIEIAQKNSDRLVLLINDILDIEKIESGKIRFETRALSVRWLLQNAVEQNSAYGEPLGVKVRLEGAEGLDSLQILGDEDRLQQVMSNLISNACKFTPAGGTVHVSAVVDEQDVCIQVRDEGPGVPPEFVSRLFEKFAQADSTSTRKQGGTGLGLAITRAIVEKHAGTIIYVAPEPGEVGACFALKLPLVSGVPEAPVKPGAGKFLICEDDPEIAELLQLIVRQNGYDASIASTLEESRVQLKTGAFAGITLDLVLPDGDGLELLAELRAAPATRDMPIIVVSGQAREGEAKGQAFDVLDWLHKPIDASRLRAALGQLGAPGSARVLHVEDDTDVRRIMAAILGDGARVTAASTVGDAREQLDNACEAGRRFDLAILDIGLPDGSGLDLVPLLAAFEPPIPIILFSASEATAEEANSVTAALVKSRTSNEALRETIHRLLNEH